MITKTKLLSIIIQQYYKKLIFNIIKIITYDIILKMLWLKKHNLILNWNKIKFIFEKYNCVITIQFTQRRKSLINE